MAVTIDAIAQATEASLRRDGADIQRWINSLSASRTTGIESCFGASLNAELERRGFSLLTEQPLSVIGTRQFYAERRRGRIDLVIQVNGEPECAAEYKAIRIPRKKGGPLFDIGQLAADFLRIQYADRIRQGFIIAFVYGPGVREAEADLWKAFHDQMYRDVDRALVRGTMVSGDGNHRAAVALDWTQPWPEHVDPDYGRSVVVGDLGAVIIECKD